MFWKVVAGKLPNVTHELKCISLFICKTFVIVTFVLCKPIFFPFFFNCRSWTAAKGLRSVRLGTLIICKVYLVCLMFKNKDADLQTVSFCFPAVFILLYLLRVLTKPWIIFVFLCVDWIFSFCWSLHFCAHFWEKKTTSLLKCMNPFFHVSNPCL